MVRDTNYTLFVNDEPKRMNQDLQRLQGMAMDYIKEGNTLTIRCPRPGGTGAQAAVLTYDKVRAVWAATK